MEVSERTQRRWAHLDSIGLEALCERIATGESLRQIAVAETMPLSPLWRWFQLTDERKKAFAEAQEIDAHGLADDLIGIADNSGEARLRYDARKWLVSKKLWRIYGDKVQNEISGPDGGAIPTSLVIKFREPK